MSTCKDCIHEDICRENKKLKIEIYDGGWLDKPRYCDFVEQICPNFKPQADYVEVKNGEWIISPHQTISKRGRVINVTTNQCSVCGRWNGRSKPNFCPNCGAKMKGGAE